ncbi:sigma-54-dependent transcriptional regulator [Erythrobacter donghaensis]|uniref:sigma-54-dependent transcriptional regulator n=1 Tax=Erythrobacter donghaensis TaxID=267135 RepID=UPI000A3BC38F|nr:response regulator [Erythrobacter donghaensis]
MKPANSSATAKGDRSGSDRLSGSGQSDRASSATARTILLIDDNDDVARAVEIAFRMAGHSVERAPNAQDAYSRLALRRFDAIILDLNFTPGKTDGSEGLACLDRILADDPGACVVLLTAHGGVRIAVTAMQAGARDFAVKPWSNADLVAKVEAAIARAPMSNAGPAPEAGAAGEARTAAPAQPASLLGECPAIAELRDLIHRIGPTDAGVTITGPSGSGRSLAAAALHASSPHAAQDAVQVDLRDASQWERLPDIRGTLILRHPDRLDDIAQQRLLAILPANARLIAIVDDPERIVPALRRRTAVVELKVPPLAERGEDAVLLARHFLRLAAERHGRPLRPLSDGAVEAIRAARWPDEVRGLALAAERAVLLADGETIGPEAFAAATPPPAIAALGSSPAASAKFDLDQTEKALIQAALREYGHNISHAAQALGLSRASLYRRMERHGL